MYYKLVNIDPGNINIEDDFWEFNPQLRYYPGFKDLYDGDKTKGKKHSSKVMWCLWMFSDPHPENTVYHRTIDQQKEIINAYYDKFPWKDQEKLSAYYDKYCISRAKRDFIESMETLSARREFLKDAEYHFEIPLIDNNTGEVVRDGRGNVVMAKETASKLDTMHKNTLTISERYDKAKNIFMDEISNSSRVLGGREKTLREKGGLILDISDEEE